jgi:hypothetical protein
MWSRRATRNSSTIGFDETGIATRNGRPGVLQVLFRLLLVLVELLLGQPLQPDVVVFLQTPSKVETGKVANFSGGQDTVRSGPS